MKKQIIKVENLEKSTRIDVYLSVMLKSFTRSKIQSLCEKQCVLINNAIANKKQPVLNGDIIEIILEEDCIPRIKPESVDLEIIFQDEFLAVVNKPKGMLVYPTESQTQNTLANALVGRFDKLSDLAGKNRPGIVHRLDKDTSGLLIVAFDNKTHQKLTDLIIDNQIIKKYKGIVYGRPKQNEGVIDATIGRNPSKRTQMCVVENGRYASTGYRLLEEYNGFSQLEFQLFTGRTHQIRVHSAFIGHPIAGDAIYGPKKVITELKGQCLHSYKLEFVHPNTAEELSFESDIPEYFAKFIKKLTT